MLVEDRMEVDAREGVTRYRYAAGGAPCIVFVSELPDDSKSVLVTVFAPQQGAYIAARGGYVTSDFVGARLPGLGILAVNLVVQVIAQALDAIAVIDQEAEDDLRRG